MKTINNNTLETVNNAELQNITGGGILDYIWKWITPSRNPFIC